jgi:hypothetical protein
MAFCQQKHAAWEMPLVAAAGFGGGGRANLVLLGVMVASMSLATKRLWVAVDSLVVKYTTSVSA